MVTGYIALTGKLQEVLLKLPAEVLNGDVVIELPGAFHLFDEIFKTGKPITARFMAKNMIDTIVNGSISKILNGGVYSMTFCSVIGVSAFFVSIVTQMDNPDVITISIKSVQQST